MNKKSILRAATLLALLTLTFPQALTTNSPTALAQTPRDEYPRVEFYGGFSHNLVTKPEGVPAIFSDRTGYNGFEVSVTRNLSRFIGLKFDFTGLYKKLKCRPGDIRCNSCATGLTCPAPIIFDSKSSLYEMTGGIQLKDNLREARINPFAHALIGVGRIDYKSYPVPDDPDGECGPACAGFSINSRGLAVLLGGGLDLRLNSRYGLRLIQFDYNGTRFFGDIQHNFRVGTGLVIR